MPIPRIGEKAPPFRLASAHGDEVALDDFKGRRAVVVWFTKGMACPFCRQQMSQLARGYPRVRELGGEVVEVTNSTPARARFYARRFTLPFPYLCDPDYAARRAWGLERRSRGPAYYARTLVAGLKLPALPNDYGDFMPALGEIMPNLSDEDMGLFVVDRAGIVRYAYTTEYMNEAGAKPVPGPDELARELERCAAAA
ncbi:MAG: AhpC/TSA family protein [Candidatus Rokubacteria bacterium]|nr:AhpC/TSA family protein [Candidatus Rokubacteria bacterium]